MDTSNEGWTGFLAGLFTPKGVDEKPQAAPAGAAGLAPAPWFLSVKPEDVAAFETTQVVELLCSATAEQNVEVHLSTKHIEACCKRLRVLCRDPATRKECHEARSAAAVVGAMNRCPMSTMTVQWHALAALVNLCSGEVNDYRERAVEAGAMPAIVAVLNQVTENAEVQEMACIALQNACFGEDEHALVRRQVAADEGAIEAVLAAMRRCETIQSMRDVSRATLRLLVHHLPELRSKAQALGARPEWVKEFAVVAQQQLPQQPQQPPQQGGGGGGGGLLSFRRAGFGHGLGTSRANNSTPRRAITNARALSLTPRSLLTPRRALGLTPRKPITPRQAADESSRTQLLSQPPPQEQLQVAAPAAAQQPAEGGTVVQAL